MEPLSSHSVATRALLKLGFWRALVTVPTALSVRVRVVDGAALRSPALPRLTIWMMTGQKP